MATCWQEIIATEVITCLRKCDSVEQPLLAMVELLLLYSKLRQATRELFGGHSQFALALKEGFSKAFQGLDEVEGVQVSSAMWSEVALRHLPPLKVSGTSSVCLSLCSRVASVLDLYLFHTTSALRKCDWPRISFTVGTFFPISARVLLILIIILPSLVFFWFSFP